MSTKGLYLLRHANNNTWYKRVTHLLLLIIAVLLCIISSNDNKCEAKPLVNNIAYKLNQVIPVWSINRTDTTKEFVPQIEMINPVASTGYEILIAGLYFNNATNNNTNSAEQQQQQPVYDIYTAKYSPIFAMNNDNILNNMSLIIPDTTTFTTVFNNYYGNDVFNLNIMGTVYQVDGPKVYKFTVAGDYIYVAAQFFLDKDATFCGNHTVLHPPGETGYFFVVYKLSIVDGTCQWFKSYNTLLGESDAFIPVTIAVHHNQESGSDTVYVSTIGFISPTASIIKLNGLDGGNEKLFPVWGQGGFSTVSSMVINNNNHVLYVSGSFKGIKLANPKTESTYAMHTGFNLAEKQTYLLTINLTTTEVATYSDLDRIKPAVVFPYFGEIKQFIIKDDTYYIVGLISGYSDREDYPFVKTNITGVYDAIIAKHNLTTDELIWLRTFGPVNNTNAGAVINSTTFDNDGYLYINGLYFGNSFTLDNFNFPFEGPVTGSKASFIMKMDPLNGKVIWATSAYTEDKNTVGIADGTNVIVDSNGNIVWGITFNNELTLSSGKVKKKCESSSCFILTSYTIGCKDGLYGENCEDVTCFGIHPNSELVCSGRGSCVGPNNCSCHNENNYGGNNCQFPICYNIVGNNPLVCGGNGHCLSPNNCSCTNPFTYEKTCEIIPPKAALRTISYPVVYSQCLPLYIATLNASDTTFAMGHDEFITYKWLATRNYNGTVTDVSKTLFPLSQTTTKDYVTFSTLLSAGNGEYTFGVNVTDSNYRLSNSYFDVLNTVTVTSVFNISIEVNGVLTPDDDKPINVIRTSDNIIDTYITNFACGKIVLSTVKYVIKLIDPATNITMLSTTTSDTLIIPENTFPTVDKNYLIEVQATSKQTTFTKRITLYVVPQQGYIQIFGGDKRTSIFNNVTLTTVLTDPDNLPFAPVCKWECRMSDMMQACPFDLTNHTLTPIFIPAYTFTKFTSIQISVECSIGGVKDVYDSSSIGFDVKALPTINLKPYDYYVSKYKDILFQTEVTAADPVNGELSFEWACTSTGLDLQKVAIAGINKKDLGIKAHTNTFNNLLVDGYNYDFQLTVKEYNYILQQTFTSWVDIKIKVNQPPTLGQLDVWPSSGLAATTVFTLTASSFIDPDSWDYPLLYAFGYFKADGQEKVMVTDYTANTITKFKLPFINNVTQVFVSVKDVYGGEVIVTQNVTLTDPTEFLSSPLITALVNEIFKAAASITDILISSSLLNSKYQELDLEVNYCGVNNTCNGHGMCNFIEKKCNCSSLYTGTYCQLLVSDQVKRENLRESMLTSVISLVGEVTKNTTNFLTTLQTVESIITDIDEINPEISKKALTYTSNVFNNTKDINLVNQVVKIVSKTIDTITLKTTTSDSNNSTTTTTTTEELFNEIRKTLMLVASQQSASMIQGQSKTINLSNIKQTIIKDNLGLIINNTKLYGDIYLSQKLNNILNSKDILSLESTFIDNLFLNTNKNVSSKIFRMNLFNNENYLNVANLTENILFNITLNQLLNDNFTFNCQYLNEFTKELSSDGMNVSRIIVNEFKNETIVECSTNHLTDFVIIKTSKTNKQIIPQPQPQPQPSPKVSPKASKSPKPPSPVPSVHNPPILVSTSPKLSNSNPPRRVSGSQKVRISEATTLSSIMLFNVKWIVLLLFVLLYVLV
ncbi:hypothetical protein ABK040_003599 [Willaertia magna]